MDTRRARPGELLRLGHGECVELLRSAPWVRIGFVADGAPTVLPINLIVHGGALFFRTASGSKLGTAAATGQVAIEADGGDPSNRVAWSVVVHGRASIVTDDVLEETLHALPDEPWVLHDTTPFWVRVEPTTITGRRIARP